MTKAELEKKIREITESTLNGKLSMKEALVKQSLILADYFADTSCNPPLSVVEIAGIAVTQDEGKLIVQVKDAYGFYITIFEDATFEVGQYVFSAETIKEKMKHE